MVDEKSLDISLKTVDLTAKKVSNIPMDILAVYNKKELESVFIQKGEDKLTLTGKEWEEIQATMRGKKYKLSSKELDGYFPLVTVLKNKDMYT